MIYMFISTWLTLYSLDNFNTFYMAWFHTLREEVETKKKD